MVATWEKAVAKYLSAIHGDRMFRSVDMFAGGIPCGLDEIPDPLISGLRCNFVDLIEDCCVTSS